MLFPWLTPLLAALACSALTTFVILRGPRSELGRVFSLAGAVLASFNLFYFVMYYVSDYDTAFYWARVFRVGTFLTTPVGVHLAIALRPSRSKTWARLLAINYAIATVFIFANLFDVFVDGLTEIPWGFTTTRTPLYEILTAYTLINGVTAISLVIYQYKIATVPRTILQLKFWMLGVTAGISLGLTNFLPAYGVPIYPLGHLGSVAFAAILAYAIVRHRLMGIDVAITKGIALAAVLCGVVAPIFGFSVYMQEKAFGRSSSEFSIVLLALFLMTGFVFPAVRQWVERQLEGTLFRATREGRETIESFARETVRIINEDELIEKLCTMVQRVLLLDRVALYLRTSVTPTLRLRHSFGVAPKQNQIETSHAICSWLGLRAEPVLALEADAISDVTARSCIVKLLSQNRWEVCVPLIGSQGVLGILGLGERANRAAYVQQDLDALAILSAEASIAFDNARLYDELRKSQDLINRAGRLSALGTFAAGIAHEVRNPLVSIQTFFQLAPARQNDEEFMKSFLPIAEEELLRIRKLINELLSFAKSPSINIREVSILELLDRTLVLLNPHARDEAVRIEVEINSEVDSVTADSDQMVQVFINLILNAIQASPKGGRVLVSVGEVQTIAERMVQVAIQDEGSGIPSEIQEAVFDPFFTTKDKGTGLGLSIAHRIVTDSGGTLTFGRGKTKGACVIVQLPRSSSEAEGDCDEVLPPTAVAMG